MALKIRITKKTYEALDETLQTHYTADGDSHFKLDVSGIEDTGALQRALARANEERDELKDENKDLVKKVSTLEKSQTDEGKDVAKLTKQHDRKITTLTEEKDAVIKSRDDFIKKTLVSGKAEALAMEISTVPKLMADHIMKRLDVDFSGDEPALVIKGKDGKPDPALKIENLKTELLANADFKPILTGSKATGSTAQKGSLPGMGATPPTNKEVNVNDLTGPAYVEHLKAKKNEAAGAST